MGSNPSGTFIRTGDLDARGDAMEMCEQGKDHKTTEDAGTKGPCASPTDTYEETRLADTLNLVFQSPDL